MTILVKSIDGDIRDEWEASKYIAGTLENLGYDYNTPIGLEIVKAVCFEARHFAVTARVIDAPAGPHRFRRI